MVIIPHLEVFAHLSLWNNNIEIHARIIYTQLGIYSTTQTSIVAMS
mgnify:CR=1 FL=1